MLIEGQINRKPGKAIFPVTNECIFLRIQKPDSTKNNSLSLPGMEMKEPSLQIAAYLLETQAVKLRPHNPFQWSSGWRSPIYCDNRVTLSYPEVRSFIKKALAQLVTASFPDVEVIGGVATAGIPQGALVADLLELPYVYVRPQAKVHGMGNQIEGRLEEGKKVVLVEDLISTGQSCLKAAEAVREAGAEVIGMAAIFSYSFMLAAENFTKAHIPLKTLCTYHDLIKVAVEEGYISEESIQTLQNWRTDPENWGRGN
jgi:orotate phosphoribosyltransferase